MMGTRGTQTRRSLVVYRSVPTMMKMRVTARNLMLCFFLAS
jgi:hypothetical protein